MIEDKDWIIPELLIKFKVLKVRHDPCAESTWIIQYKNCESFTADEKAFDTIEVDEQLVDQEIEAQIDLSVEEILPTTKKEKTYHVVEVGLLLPVFMRI
ncbi:hypothetical protein MIDIC_140027 [Alphaproteobacteria bacterium]